MRTIFAREAAPHPAGRSISVRTTDILRKSNALVVFLRIASVAGLNIGNQDDLGRQDYRRGGILGEVENIWRANPSLSFAGDALRLRPAPLMRMTGHVSLQTAEPYPRGKAQRLRRARGTVISRLKA